MSQAFSERTYLLFSSTYQTNKNGDQMPSPNQGVAIQRGSDCTQESVDLSKLALDVGASESKTVSPDLVVVQEWVRLKCQFGCPEFGKRLTCPPFTPRIDEVKRILSEYSKIQIVKFDQPPISKRLGAEGFMKEFNKRQRRVNEATLNIEKQLLMKGYYKAFALEPGICNRCKQCVTQQGKCRHPTEARPSPEAFAIDMFSTVKNAGWDLELKTDVNQSWTNYALILLE
jgi:predicted metal-binding protein